jgi:6-pyruvoyltetrahydropterin/6-carboxytetrahydropterin synthase
MPDGAEPCALVSARTLMAHFLLSAEATFSAAHTLPGVPQCDRMHGHNWRVRVTVRVDATALDRHGMGVDFRVIERATRDAVAEFDHAYLNECAPFHERPPTAERMAVVVAQRVRDRLAREAAAARIAQVDVWELPQYRVSYRPD